MYKFPKNIFQVWFQGYENITNNIYKQNMNNWQLLNPDWNYKCVNDSDLRKASELFSVECLNAYNNAKFMHAKIDLGKLLLIYLYGGIMIDMDMAPLRKLSSSKYVNDVISFYDTIPCCFKYLMQSSKCLSAKAFASISKGFF